MANLCRQASDGETNDEEIVGYVVVEVVDLLLVLFVVVDLLWCQLFMYLHTHKNIQTNMQMPTSFFATTGGKLMRIFMLWYDNVQDILENMSEEEKARLAELARLEKLRLIAEENERRVKRALNKMFNRLLAGCYSTWVDLVDQRSTWRDFRLIRSNRFYRF